MQPRVTVIIPTRNRPDTLVHCLKTVTMQNNLDIEILVSDNGDTPTAQEIVDTACDIRVRCIRPETVLGMTEHWEFALSQAKGEWIGFLGDDDGLLPGAIDFFLSAIADRNVRAFSSRTGKFFWPDTNAEHLSRLMVPTAQNISEKKSDVALQAVMAGDEPFTILPCIYTGGFLKRDLIEQVKGLSNGRFFASMIPDAYSGIAAALCTDSYIYSSRPISLAGVSRHSNGHSQSGWKQKDAKHIEFFNTTTIGFEPALGSGVVNTAQILVYESWLKARHLDTKNRQFDLMRQLSLSMLYAQKGCKKDVVAYCRDVAKKNGISLSALQRDFVLLRLVRKVSKIAKNLKNVVFYKKYKAYVRINGDRQLASIYDACLRAREIIAQKSA